MKHRNTGKPGRYFQNGFFETYTRKYAPKQIRPSLADWAFLLWLVGGIVTIAYLLLLAA